MRSGCQQRAQPVVPVGSIRVGDRGSCCADDEVVEAKGGWTATRSRRRGFLWKRDAGEFRLAVEGVGAADQVSGSAVGWLSPATIRLPSGCVSDAGYARYRAGLQGFPMTDRAAERWPSGRALADGGQNW